MLSYFYCIFVYIFATFDCMATWASIVFALAGFLSLHKTPELLYRLENVTRASSAIVVSRKRVEKCQIFGVDYPFKYLLGSLATNLRCPHWWVFGDLHLSPDSCAGKPAEGTASRCHWGRPWLLPGPGCRASLLAGTWHWGWLQALPHAWRSSAEAVLWATGGRQTQTFTHKPSKSEVWRVTGCHGIINRERPLRVRFNKQMHLCNSQAKHC